MQFSLLLQKIFFVLVKSEKIWEKNIFIDKTTVSNNFDISNDPENMRYNEKQNNSFLILEWKNGWFQRDKTVGRNK